MRNIRRSQMVSPYGVGSIVNFPREESLMTAGLDAWQFSRRAGHCPSEFLVGEERLAARLGVAEFRLPPDYRRPAAQTPGGTGMQNMGLKVPFVRFPRWHYCRNCGNMEQLGLYSLPSRCPGRPVADGRSCAGRPDRTRPLLQPVRFVAICPKHGHIQDFPFMDWAHQGQSAPTRECHLRWRVTGSTSSLGGILIRCSCGASRSLHRVTDKDSLENLDITCAGHRPWLGEVDDDTAAHCGEQLQVVQRGGSNVYFAHIASSIYLPLWAEREDRRIIDVLENPANWTSLTTGLTDNQIDIIRCQIIAGFCGLEGREEELREAAQRRLDNVTGPQAPRPISAFANKYEEEENYRRPEYDALRDKQGTVDSDFRTEAHDLTLNSEYEAPLTGYFSKIVQVTKLRETRALYGFSRYSPEDARSMQEKIAQLRLDPGQSWLPAAVTRGEGIFFELNAARLDCWMKTPGVQARIDDLAAHYNQAILARIGTQRTVTPKFVLLHTLAHLLIIRLSYECGYGSASLRERIYCDAEVKGEKPMSGFLIYTAAGDSEGTMGGLVRQGQPGRIEGILKRALRQAAWCSYDPVCVESAGQGPDTSNLAACHGCAILPETSCEEGNKLLDRVMVAGKPDAPQLGYFGPYLQEL